MYQYMHPCHFIMHVTLRIELLFSLLFFPPLPFSYPSLLPFISLVGELARELPALSHVFLNERDLVLTNSLMNIANCLTDPCGPPVNVVGVVGIGHVNGIKEHWMGTECRDISSLLTVSEPHWSSRLFWCYFQWCMVSMFNVGLYWVGRTCLRAMARRFFSIF